MLQEQKWSKAMKKEISMMFNYNLFEVKPRGYKFNSKEGWQFAPLH